MYRVVIVDDEPVIVEGLSKGIEWEKWNCKVAGTAGSSAEGIRVIRSVRPDLLITDISMPGEDGLVMIAALRSEFPDMQVSILTGYREFDYAKRALELGVTRFLLKPSKFAELEEAITAMTERAKERPAALETEPGANGGHAGEGESAEGELTGDPGANNFLVHNAMEYMRAHYSDKLRLIDVADHVYVSQWHLSKLLNGVTGKNFSELLNEIRMEKATELLKDPSLRISDIAEMVGYADIAHFSRVFKKIEGVSAGDYRNKSC